MNTKNKTTKKYINGSMLNEMVYNNPLTQELSNLMLESDKVRIKAKVGNDIDTYLGEFISKYKIKDTKTNRTRLLKDLGPIKTEEEDKVLNLFRSFYEKMHKNWEDLMSGDYAVDINYLKVKDYYMRLRMIFFEELSLFGNYKAHNEVVNSR